MKFKLQNILKKSVICIAYLIPFTVCYADKLNENTYDYIVVGAGTAGSVVAARLAEAGHSVVVLEAGPDTSPTSGLPDIPSILTAVLSPFYSIEHVFDPDVSDPFSCSQLQTNKVMLDFVTENQETGEIFGYPRGAGAGGSAVIATGLYDGIGSLKLYDQIAAHVQDNRWGRENILRLAKKIETAYPARNSDFYGNDGWLKISQSTVEIQNPIYQDIFSSANSLGIPTVNNFREPGNDSGIGLTDSHVFSPFASSGQGDGYRSYSYKDLLMPTMFNPETELEVKFNSFVSKIILVNEDEQGENNMQSENSDNSDNSWDGKTHKAIGVEVLSGAFLQDIQVGAGSVIDGDNGNCVLIQPPKPEPELKKYYARKEVILSAGTFQSPQLLMLSGIGDAAELKEVGITPQVNLPGVGKNIADHVEVFTWFEMDPKKWFSTTYATLISATGADMFYEPDIQAQIHANTNFGIFAESPNAVIIDWPSGVAGSNDPEQPDIHAMFFAHGGPLNFNSVDLGLHPPVDLPFDIHDHGVRYFAPDPEDPLTPPGIPNLYNLILAPFNPIQPRIFAVWLLENVRPSIAPGFVKLRSNDPTDSPIINMGLYKDEVALERLAAGVQLVRQIMNHPSIKNNYAKDPNNVEFLPGKSVSTVQDLKTYFKEWSTFGHHPSGGAAIGAKGDPMAVLDSEMRVRKVKNLRVVDSSVFPAPLIPGFNNTRAAYIVGELAAEMIKKK